MPYKIQQKYLTSFDGTKIGYQVVGKGPRVFVLCNGLGGTMLTWSPIYNRWGDQFKFITWDYRGLFSSDKPKNEHAITIPDHALDLKAILKKEKVTKALFGGWSMGVQVCLEFYRHQSQLYQGLFLINGTYGAPLDTALNSRLVKYIFPYLNRLLKKALPKIQPRIQPLAEQVIDRDDFINIVSRVGLTHANMDRALFKQVAQEMLKTDLVQFQHILDHLAEHDASDLLESIHVPTLLVSSSEDILTPSIVAENMADKIPQAELFVLNNASHYSLLEFPEIINNRLKQFLKEHFKITQVKTKTSIKK